MQNRLFTNVRKNKVKWVSLICNLIWVIFLNSLVFSDEIKQVVIQDDAGRIISIQQPFKRIISLYGAHTENLCALGIQDQLIGVSPNDHFPNDAKSKPTFSYHDDPEKFIAAKPDLILIRPMIDRGYAKLFQRLEQFHIQIASFQPNTIQEMYAYWLNLGTLTGKKDAAVKMVDSFQKAIELICNHTQKIPVKKRVYFEAIHQKMKTFSPDSMAILALTYAGGINLASDAEPVSGTNIANYGKERLLSLGQQIDVYLAQQGTMNPISVERIQQEPGFELIKAVQQNQIYIVDEMLVSRPTYRLLQGILNIGRILYPDVFNSIAQELKHRNIVFKDVLLP
ncbi:MAG: ABC transporter substrate-binding protein [Desulfobacterales bacterium]|nr:ABC transporter substrate-binding protein [Desulfobacterales bacterium]